MKLTGKCKKDFGKYIEDKNIDEWNSILDMNGFLKYPFSMQYGVYVDFFDSVGIFIDSMCINKDDFTSQIWNKYSKKSLFDGNVFKTHHESRTEAIKKANEIYNSKIEK